MRRFPFVSLFKPINQNGVVRRSRQAKPQKDRSIMTKTSNTFPEILHAQKYPFRKAENLPGKAQRHRYERRKVKGVLRFGDWESADA